MVATTADLYIPAANGACSVAKEEVDKRFAGVAKDQQDMLASAMRRIFRCLVLTLGRARFCDME
jgi:hypothetical protein